MLPQPPPDAQAPLPSEHAIRSQKKWRWLWICGVISIVLLVLTFVIAPITTRGHRRADLTEAINNSRQIGIALCEFETEYGSFPDSTTISRVRTNTLSDLDLGTKSSNDYFRQLLASGIAQSEPMFYARIDGTRKPDGVLSKGEALKARECGFTYFLGAKSTDNPKRPLVATPMIAGSDRFDSYKIFNGKAVVLHLDQSVRSYPIDKSGHALIDGRNMLDPHHPIWDGHPPTIAWPEL